MHSYKQRAIHRLWFAGRIPGTDYVAESRDPRLLAPAAEFAVRQAVQTTQHVGQPLARSSC
jgi:hypothetical protein